MGQDTERIDASDHLADMARPGRYFKRRRLLRKIARQKADRFLREEGILKAGVVCEGGLKIRREPDEFLVLFTRGALRPCLEARIFSRLQQGPRSLGYPLAQYVRRRNGSLLQCEL